MSVRDAAGWALPRCQSVSVVPMIQCRPQGMTNKTLVSVRRISPVVDWIRSRGTTRWIALGRAHVKLAVLADHLLRLVGPHAGGVDDLFGPHLEVATGLEVAHLYAGDPLAVAEEADDACAVCAQRAVGGRGPNDGEGVAGVIDLGVVVLDRADERVRAQRRAGLQRGLLGQVPVPGQPARVARRPAHRVVEKQAEAGVDPLPAAVPERVEERHRAHQVRGQPLGEQAALAQCLADQPEVEHLEVAQAAVDQLAGPAGRPGGPVAAPRRARRSALGSPRPRRLLHRPRHHR